MIVARGLGRPNQSLVTGGLGRFSIVRALYAFIGGEWRQVTDVFVHNGAEWVPASEVHVATPAWLQIWGWPT